MKQCSQNQDALTFTIILLTFLLPLGFLGIWCGGVFLLKFFVRFGPNISTVLALLIPDAAPPLLLLIEEFCPPLFARLNLLMALRTDPV